MEGLAKSELGRRFYFELFPDYEILTTFQYKGYEKYLEEEKTYEGQLFGNCILFLKSYFEKDTSAMKVKWQKIVKLFNSQKKCHHFVLGRFYHAHIIGTYYFNNAETYSVINKAYKVEEKLKTSQNKNDVFGDFPGFHYFVCDALNCIGEYEDLLRFSFNALNGYQRTEEFIWKGYYDQLYLYHALALANLGDKQEAKKLLKHINSERFYFISEMYFKNKYNELLGLIQPI